MTRYKDDTLQAIQKDPHAFDFAGINPQDGEELHTLLNKAAAYEDTLLQLQINELDCRFAYPLFKKYSETAPQILKRTPYLPYTEGIYDFKTADKLYLNYDNPADGLPRRTAVMRAAMQNDLEGNGNLFIPRKQLEAKMAAFLKKETGLNTEKLLFADGTVEETITQMQTFGEIIVDDSFGEENIYLHSSYHMETTAAENITRIWQGEKRLDCDRAGIETFLEGFEASHGYALTAEQEQAVFMALTSPVSIISGLSKNAIYTALTRAKQCVVLIGGRQDLMDSLVRETALERKSNLMKRLQAQILRMTFEPSPAETDVETGTVETDTAMADAEQLTLSMMA